MCIYSCIYTYIYIYICIYTYITFYQWSISVRQRLSQAQNGVGVGNMTPGY